MNFSPARRTRSRSLSAILTNAAGAIDLASIMVGVLVIGIIGAVIAATVFAVVPWSQDEAAKGNLHAAAQAEGVVRTAGTAPVYLQYDSTSTDHLALEQSSPGSIQRPGQRLIVDTNAAGTTYVAAQLSATGQVFLSSSDDPTPRPAVDAGYVLASYDGHPGTVVSTLSAPAGFIVPAGIASTVPQALIHAEVTAAAFFTPPLRVMSAYYNSGDFRNNTFFSTINFDAPVYSLYRVTTTNGLVVTVEVPTVLTSAGAATLYESGRPSDRSYGDIVADWTPSAPRTVGNVTQYAFTFTKASNASQPIFGYTIGIPAAAHANGTYTGSMTVSAPFPITGELVVSKTGTFSY